MAVKRPLLILPASAALVLGALVASVVVDVSRKRARRPRAFLKKGRKSTTETLVVCAGASMVQGIFSADFVEVLCERLCGRGYEFVNAGVGGYQSRDLLRHIERVVACRPDAVTILIGTNDATAALDEETPLRSSPERPTPERYRENLETILGRLNEETDARIALLSLPPLGEDPNEEINRSLARYNEVIEEVATDHGAAYLPLGERLRAMLREAPSFCRTYRFSLRLTLSAALLRYVGRRSWDEAAARNGFLLLTDGVHLGDRAAAVAADLIAGWLIG